MTDSAMRLECLRLALIDEEGVARPADEAVKVATKFAAFVLGLPEPKDA